MNLGILDENAAALATQNLTYALKCVAYDDAYLRMDANGVDKPAPEGAGTVNAQIGAGSWEQFILTPQDGGTVALLSAEWSNCYVRIGTPSPQQIKPINCQFSCGPLEKWLMRFVGPNRVAFECSTLSGYYLSLNTEGAKNGSGNGVGIAQGIQELNENATFELVSQSG
ncbi:hypothetical protein PhaeoP23_00153 [Phaeobacter piscinae]|uniref:Uncharacterized protein n=1 Tax=Phaeobacter piscinae TaxID=1580596 RepID=A0ABM6P9L2_9RHOB|nr:hypothetical protein [Phaeobacter piscinae]ATG34327.1 hypothetical protein PhaeoP36_00154 [Phaeobacter piscinae]AUQ84847.1 hypothetical protein PhaeoP42_00154 [Phaeobacter piscinae]AUR22730.1 hypothetical protein PhaeoP23_00153 [Phaeobacter piscinae]